ncbi:tRNA-splicing endonuclease subunit [Diplocarpon rosae]|nr:tRNA-splicing endonuclease subunit [Diplocarpon rosae]
MADITPKSPADLAIPTNAQSHKAPGPYKACGPTKLEQLNKLYALPAPLRTYPLPTFVPHNPLSLFHILFVWVSQSFSSPSSHADRLFQGWFSPETRSVHVTDARSVRGLWEQGFYGKGTLSRSEPSWLTREQARLGTGKKKTSLEDVTRQRRLERQVMKWERARKEREAIDSKLQEEAEAAASAKSVEDKPNEKISLGGKVSPPAETVIDSPTQPFLVAEDVVTMNVPADAVISGTRPLVEDMQMAYKSFNTAAPVGPLELLALPNSQAELHFLGTKRVDCFTEDFHDSFVQNFFAPPVGPLELLALPNSINSFLPLPPALEIQHSFSDLTFSQSDGRADANDTLQERMVRPTSNVSEDPEIPGDSETTESTSNSVHSLQTTDTFSTNPSPIPSTPRSKCQKSVRFSPTVEKTTFLPSEPPSPERAVPAPSPLASALPAVEPEIVAELEPRPLIITNQEHTQLTLEEAFFLSYALGALNVLSPLTSLPLSNRELFTLCLSHSSFPPSPSPSSSDPTNNPGTAYAPDAPFLLNYVVYHHFRSLGWVVRSGIKFSVDYVLYTRGPVFTHAEFCVLILPSYTHTYWSSTPELSAYGRNKEERTWAWLSCVNRVVTQIKKTLVLVYVEIPPPLEIDSKPGAGRECDEGEIANVLGRYKIREVVLKRWAANRMRD